MYAFHPRADSGSATPRKKLKQCCSFEYGPLAISLPTQILYPSHNTRQNTVSKHNICMGNSMLVSAGYGTMPMSVLAVRQPGDSQATATSRSAVARRVRQPAPHRCCSSEGSRSLTMGGLPATSPPHLNRPALSQRANHCKALLALYPQLAHLAPPQPAGAPCLFKVLRESRREGVSRRATRVEAVEQRKEGEGEKKKKKKRERERKDQPAS